MPSSHADRVARWSTEDRASEGPRAEVLADIEAGLISAEVALRDYGVTA